jgi:spectrin beta
LQGALGTYRETLAGALEIHLFNRDIDDTNQRVVEKSLAMNTTDVGKDLAGVEQLQRKQETMERDMTAIEGKLKVSFISVKYSSYETIVKRILYLLFFSRFTI